MSVNNQFYRSRFGQIINSSSLDLNTEFRGNLIPFGDEEHDLGSASNKWHELYVGTIHYGSLDPPVGGGGGNGSSQWITSGSNIYYNLGNVGIGSSTPSAKLDISGTVRINGTLNMNSNSINNVNDINAVNLKGSVCYCDTLDERSTTGNILILENLDFATIKSINRAQNVNSINVNCSTVNSTNINTASITSTNIIVPSTSQLNNVSSVNITNSGNVITNSITSGNIISSNISNNNSITSNTIISNVITVGQLNYTTLNPPVGGVVTNPSKFFYNRLTNIPLNVANTRTQIPIASGSLGTDYAILTNTDFFIASNSIFYGGFATKNFYVQASFAWLAGASASNMGIELVRNTTPISQGRWNTSSSTNLDIQDFNFVTLENADSLSFFYSASNAGGNLVANSQTNMTGSTTKPIQIWITEI